METKNWRVLAFMNCNLAADSLRDLELPKLRSLRLHGTTFTHFPALETLESLPSLKHISLQVPFGFNIDSEIIELPKQLECLEVIKSNAECITRILEIVTVQRDRLPYLKLVAFKKPLINTMSPSKAIAISHMLQWLSQKGLRVEPAVGLQIKAERALLEDAPEWEVNDWTGYYPEDGLMPSPHLQ
ncbi:hypothetical protein P389DRAFT_170869 [Cystobasidium minutum MCA 4210]|uniref:uncharacterized protein n=1 Tax=Cystobasidium minutum MCA 4210 TaxID=1397322 RepID=UPI0034CD4747|eukprot:jgi/Rhomi1/170869/fgenesh1_kg.4_\